MSKKIIESAYEMIGDNTPLKSNCGKLCDAACCSSDGYMLVFPYEHEILKGSGFDIQIKQLDGYGSVYTAACDGTCDRDTRPLSCRIFPLAPKIIDDKLLVRMDPRARNVCPISHKSILSLDKEFTNIIKKTLNMMYQDAKMAQYLKAISEIADKYNNII